MTVLAFDTSTGGCSAAVLRDGAVLAHAFEVMERGQAERLLPMIGEVMVEAGVTFETLDLIATTTGPGAFTGLRIGLSAAQGLSLAANRPGCGITTFEALVEGFLHAEAHGKTAGEVMVVAVESKRADVFVQIFAADGMMMGEPLALSPDSLANILPDEPLVLLGDAAKRCFDRLKFAREGISVATGPGLVDACDVARLAEHHLKSGSAFPPLLPFYMRPPDAKVPKNGGQLRPTPSL